VYKWFEEFTMNRRIGLWVLAGLAVASIWVLFSFVTPPPHYNFDRWAILNLSAPAAIICRSIHAPIKFYTFIAMNGAVYGLIGLAVEPLWRMIRRQPARLS
jgi:hypothetical protein